MASLANQTISSTYDGLVKTSTDQPVGVSGVQLLEDGVGNSLALSVGRANQGVTVTGPLTGTLSATSVLADGVIATTQATSDNSTKVATTAYVKSVVTAEDLDIAGDSGTGSVDLDSQTLTIAGTANEIETSASGQTITIGLPSTITANVTGNVAGDLTGTVLTAAQANITSVGTLSSLAVSGNLTVDTNTLFVDAANNKVVAENSSAGNATNALVVRNSGSLVVNTESRLYLSTVAGDNRGCFIASKILNTNNENALILATNSVGSDATERMRIDSSGNVGIGTSSPAVALDVRSASLPTFRVSRDGAAGSGGAARILFEGREPTLGTGQTASISGGAGGIITFNTGGTSGDTDGGTEKMRITSGGDIFFGNNGSLGRISDAGLDRLLLQSEGDELLFGTDGAMHSFMSANTGVAFSVIKSYDDLTDLGRVDARFDDIYATNGTIQTSDANEKQQIEDLDDAELRVATQIKGLIKKFKWNKAVDRKGDDARIHIGIIAQDVKAAFEAEGLDADRYGLFISSTWTDEETGEEKTRLGIRYNELLSFIIASL